MIGRIGDVKMRRSMNLNSWEQAKQLVAKWNSQGFLDSDLLEEPANEAPKEIPQSPAPTQTGTGPPPRGPVTVEDTLERFFRNLHARRLSPATLKKYRVLLERQLATFCQARGFRYTEELGISELDDFVGSLKDSPISTIKKIERLTAFFRWCHSRKIIAENPSAELNKPEARIPPTLPFSVEQMAAVLDACDRFLACDRKPGGQNGKRLKALVLLMRYSGLRIGDALRFTDDPTPILIGPNKVVVPPHIIDGHRLFVYTQKTGTNVYVPMPPFFFEALAEVQKVSSRFYFWTGKGKITTRIGNLARSLKSLFRKAGIPDGHSHRFRDTFAVELLKEGVPVEAVAVLLGHRSIKITEKHYSPWVKERQERLERQVRKGWKLPQKKIVSFRTTGS
jgi:site-specific recombinase XerD